ncbi:PTS sugar transporter subunit IIA [Xylocopilactobacillus apis]|uniref:PTS mannose transporter subunit IIAB n=1 Tax=Xylocopilactobacillus apis TaxID=2932183 RepID=A0AAU9CSM1_9LACO|nr:fructose PTS transporter subunit IIA [Xylocopilactobacillus apis]BDR56984.1 PTS mannose transporter subunit IIAB [Xylocopilactobacillus apis]
MILSQENIFLNVKETDKDDILHLIAQKSQLCGLTDDVDGIYQAFVDRESEFSTGLPDGFAIPHAKTDAAKKVGILYFRLTQPVDWQSLDDELVTDLFALIVPNENAGKDHLQMISSLATALLDQKFKKSLRELQDPKKLTDLINKNMEVTKS